MFQSIVFLSPPNSAGKNTWSLYLIELLIRGQIDQLGFAFFLFGLPHFDKSKRGLHVCRWGRPQLWKHYGRSFQVLSKKLWAFFLLEVPMWTQLPGGLFSPSEKWKKKIPSKMYYVFHLACLTRFTIQKIKEGFMSLNSPLFSKRKLLSTSNGAFLSLKNYIL